MREAKEGKMVERKGKEEKKEKKGEEKEAGEKNSVYGC